MNITNTTSTTLFFSGGLNDKSIELRPNATVTRFYDDLSRRMLAELNTAVTSNKITLTLAEGEGPGLPGLPSEIDSLTFKSPDETLWELTVDDTGNLVTTEQP
jgi:hypothetical protein